jgi:hypothetical protein
MSGKGGISGKNWAFVKKCSRIPSLRPKNQIIYPVGLYDLQGRCIRQLLNARQGRQASHTLMLDTKACAAGMMLFHYPFQQYSFTFLFSAGFPS